MPPKHTPPEQIHLPLLQAHFRIGKDCQQLVTKSDIGGSRAEIEIGVLYFVCLPSSDVPPLYLDSVLHQRQNPRLIIGREVEKSFPP